MNDLPEIPPADRLRIAVLMTCHDRRDQTVECLSALRQSADRAGVLGGMTLHLVDDGSSDGTAAAVRGLWESADVIAGDGDLFWAAGMARAEAAALAGEPEPDLMLWLNDDVTLTPDALAGLLSTARTHPGVIVVGALSGEAGRITYSGAKLTSSWHPLRWELVVPGDAPVAVDAMNGNLVLVPLPVARRLGAIDGGFSHAFADFDYALRAREAGIPVLLAPGVMGSCERDHAGDTGATPGERWRRISDRKGLAISDQARFLRRHGHFAAPLLLLVPYVKFVLGEIRRLPVIRTLARRRSPN